MYGLSTDRYRHREQLKRLLEKIDRDADVVVVEGKSDTAVLRKMGCSSAIEESAGRQPDVFAADVGASHETAVVLTDFDTHGKEVADELSHLLAKECDVLHTYRERFGKLLTERGRMCVEDIRPLLGDHDRSFREQTLDRLFTGLS